MFRNHNINKKNIKNQYSITTSDHTSDNIFTTTISNQNDNDLNISSTSLYFNNQKFPASDGSNSQLLSTNGNGVLSWIDSVNLAHINIVSDENPELGGDLSLNNKDITGTGNINITGTIQSSGSITCSDLTVNGSTTHINTSTLTVDDSLIYLGENNNANTLDLGWYGKFNDGSVKWSGVILDASSGKFKLFETSIEPSITVSNIVLKDLELNNLDCNSITSGTWSGSNLTQLQITDLTTDLTTLTNNISSNDSDISSLNSSVSSINSSISTNTSSISSLNSSVSTNTDKWSIAGNELYRLSNVGIGTNNPSEKLDVNGTGKFTGLQVNGNLGVAGSFTPQIHLAIGDSDTGFKQQGDGKLAIYTNNQERVRIQSGNVGIGNSSPSYKLDVSGSTRVSGNGLFTGGTLTLQVVGSNTGTGGNCARVAVASSNAREAGFSLGNSSSTANCDERWLIGRKYNSGSAFPDIAFFYTTDNGGTNGAGYSEKMRIKTNGNVGIGTNNPSEKLDVNGTGKFTGLQVTGNLGVAGSFTPQIHLAIGDNDTGFHQQGDGKLAIYTNNQERVRIQSGNVGIGNSSPSKTLDVTGTARITSDLTVGGNVGIGTNNPAERLHVYDTTNSVMRIGNNEAGSLEIKSWSEYGTTLSVNSQNNNYLTSAGATRIDMNKDYIKFSTAVSGTAYASISWSERMRIKNDGNVGIGTNNPNRKLTMYVDNSNNNYDGLFIYDKTSGSNQSLIQLARHNQNGTGYMRIYNQSNATNGILLRGGGQSYINGGNVGIGTATPVETLDVHGTARFGSDGKLTINSRITSNGSETVALQTTIDNRALSAPNPGTYGGEARHLLVLQPDGGYVGIGTATPGNNRLRVTKTIGGDDMSALQHNTQLAIHGIGEKSMAIGIMDDGKGMIQVKESGIGYNILALNPVSGNVGIGTIIPSKKLHVNGDIQCHDIYSTSFEIINNKINTHHNNSFEIDTALDLYFQTDGSTKMILKNNGNFGIGTIAPSKKLHVNGDIQCNGNFFGGVGSVVRHALFDWEDNTSVSKILWGWSSWIFTGSENNQTTVASGNWTTLVTGTYTKISSTSLNVKCYWDYTVSGFGSDSFRSRLKITSDGTSVYSREGHQAWVNNSGGGTRSSTLSPRCVNTGTSFVNKTSITIELQVRRYSADDTYTNKYGSFEIWEIVP